MLKAASSVFIDGENNILTLGDITAQSLATGPANSNLTTFGTEVPKITASSGAQSALRSFVGVKTVDTGGVVPKIAQEYLTMCTGKYIFGAGEIDLSAGRAAANITFPDSVFTSTPIVIFSVFKGDTEVDSFSFYYNNATAGQATVHVQNTSGTAGRFGSGVGVDWIAIQAFL